VCHRSRENFFKVHITNNLKRFGEKSSKGVGEILCIDLWTKEVFIQKMEYIHHNPVAAGLCTYPEQYKYSSEKF